MTTTNCEKFKGEIENYLVTGQNNIDSKINNVFCSLKCKNMVMPNQYCKKRRVPCVSWATNLKRDTFDPLFCLSWNNNSARLS